MSRRKNKFHPTVHAIERIREYFDISELHAVDFAQELMRDAKFVMHQRDKAGKASARIYKNDKRDVMIVVDASKNVIITVLPPKSDGEESPMPEVNPFDATSNPFLIGMREVYEREARKMKRKYTREARNFAEQIALLGVEVAQLALNKARAKSPITQGHIQRRIDALQVDVERLTADKRALDTQYSEAKAVIAE